MRELKIIKDNSKEINTLSKFEIDHSHKCIINLDSSSDSVSSYKKT